MEDYVWYFAYGSNIMKERFLCYITGDSFKWRSGDSGDGCTNKDLPQDSKEYKINYKLYFAQKAASWDNQGVAFISPKETLGHEIWGRVWKITKEQFEEIWKQEGRGEKWYPIKIELGHIEEIPIWTITSFKEKDRNKPSKKYVKTIMCGLEETYKGKNEGTKSEICNYLSKKEGIKNEYSLENLKELFNTNEP